MTQRGGRDARQRKLNQIVKESGFERLMERAKFSRVEEMVTVEHYPYHFSALQDEVALVHFNLRLTTQQVVSALRMLEAEAATSSHAYLQEAYMAEKHPDWQFPVAYLNAARFDYADKVRKVLCRKIRGLNRILGELPYDRIWGFRWRFAVIGPTGRREPDHMI